MAENNGARSYKTEIVGDDSFALTLNFKFLLNIFAIFGSLIFAYATIEERISELERSMKAATEEISLLIDKHIEQESIAMNELQKKVSWYEKEVGLNLNPLSWKKRNK